MLTFKRVFNIGASRKLFRPTRSRANGIGPIIASNNETTTLAYRRGSSAGLVSLELSLIILISIVYKKLGAAGPVANSETFRQKYSKFTTT